MERRKNINFVIGAAGSIGSELSRQLKDKYTVVGIDQDESGLFDLEGIIPEISNIRNKERLEELFLKYKPKTVFHAAAYKHLSKYEREHLEEIVLTNVIGTLNIIKLCAKYNSKLVFISTDKAVNPTSLMGATKLLGEIMVKRYRGIVVRFGNVMWSRGSVLNIWARQANKNEPLTITDKRMKRYFMSIKDAVILVIKASEQKSGTYILDMGQQKLITEFAFKQFGVRNWKFIGIKEGEKLEEELMTEDEKKRAIKFKGLWKI